MIWPNVRALNIPLVVWELGWLLCGRIVQYFKKMVQSFKRFSIFYIMFDGILFKFASFEGRSPLLKGLNGVEMLLKGIYTHITDQWTRKK